MHEKDDENAVLFLSSIWHAAVKVVSSFQTNILSVGPDHKLLLYFACTKSHRYCIGRVASTKIRANTKWSSLASENVFHGCVSNPFTIMFKKVARFHEDKLGNESCGGSWDSMPSSSRK